MLAADACSILDLVRSQHRLETPSRLLEMALAALGASTQQPKMLHLVVFRQIRDEVERNVDRERLSLKNHMRTLRNTGATVLSASQQESWLQGLETIESALAHLPQAWIDASLLVSDDADCKSRAQSRLARGAPPGKRGSANIGDCLIVEHLLELGRQLRKANFAPNILFISSNVRDFGRGSLKPPLDSEFQTENILYLPDIEAAMTELGY